MEFPETIDVSGVPEAILTIPFVANMLTVTMLLGTPIEVQHLDAQFTDSIKNIEQVYHNMYPHSRLSFNVQVKKTVDCSYEPQNIKSLFFTGGLDATSALAQTASEKPLLINIWGGDISTDDNKSHAHLEEYFQRLTRQIGNEYVFIKSNCREMYNEEKVTKLWGTRISPFKNHGWWANIGHILSMSSLIAPIVYAKKISVHYIGSSYDSKSSTFDANNAELLNAIKFGNIDFISVDENRNRMQKAKTVIEFSNRTEIPLELKVCWYRQAGRNCSRCEKCYRTIMNIVVNHGDPNDFGFAVNSDTFREMRMFLSENYVNAEFWNEIQKGFLQNRTEWERNGDLSWILEFRFNSFKAIRNKAMSIVKRFTK